ncbi:MAG: Crp/Fnr family transcriptional regulator [Clostridiales bacterium]|nr:Crp/Fnr family transcriptional regulator [Clostridiales bacterium]
MTDNNLIKLLKNTPIFKNVETKLLNDAIKKSPYICKDFAKGETIISVGSDKKALALITKGKATVYKGNGTHKVIMGVSNAGTLFGAVTLYNPENEFVTSIVADCITQVVFFEKEFVDYVLEKNTEVAKNYIEYLSQRIYFLNKKIDSFTGNTATSRLASWLYENCDDTSKVTLPCSISSFSKRIDIGRASLYRAFSELEEEKIISRDNKNIVIKDKLLLSEKI